MNIIKVLLIKEFKQIFRNKIMVKMIFILPIVQLFVLVNAASSEIKEAKIIVADYDNSSLSNDLTRKFEGSTFFKIVDKSVNSVDNQAALSKNNTDVIINIPKDFEKDIIGNQNIDVQILINAINSMKAGIINGYMNNIFKQYNTTLSYNAVNKDMSIKSINVVPRYWFNTMLDYKIYMVPGILVILVTIIGMFLTALNLVKEKETGTAEQINVTPVKRQYFLLCKMLPFWFIGMFEIVFGLVIGYFFFGMPVMGSLLLIFSFAGVFLFVILGLGLFFSTVADTQQQILFIAYFVLIVFIIMSGLFTPVESMPVLAQKLNLLNPLYYCIRAMRMIILTGSDFSDLVFEFFALIVYGLIINSLAVLNYKKSE